MFSSSVLELMEGIKMTKLEQIRWDQEQRCFKDDGGLEVQLEIVAPPRVFHTDASAGSPLCDKINGFVQKAVEGTHANAYRAYGDILPNHQFPDARWSPAIVTVELYRLLGRKEI